MEELITCFEETLFDPMLSDVCTELTEIGIDSLFDSPIVDNIPIAKSIIGIAKTAKNIHERNLLIQTKSFAFGFQEEKTDEKKIRKYRKRIAENRDYAEAELGRILIILNKTVEKKKSVIYGRLFKAYVQEYISWDEFCELTEAVNGLFVSDIPFLLRAYNGRIDNPDKERSYQSSRLNAIGLVIIQTADANVTVGTIHLGSFISISEFGIKLVRYGLNEGLADYQDYSLHMRKDK